MSSESEILCLEVCPYKSKRPTTVAGVYRPPSSKSQDDINIGNNIENAYLFNKELIILGDFNIDVFKPDYFKHKLIRTLKKFYLVQLVNQVTRLSSQTCLDHVWVTHPDRITAVETKVIGLTDHLPTIVLRQYKQNDTKEPSNHRSFTYRDFKHLDVQAFVQYFNEAL